MTDAQHKEPFTESRMQQIRWLRRERDAARDAYAELHDQANEQLALERFGAAIALAGALTAARRPDPQTDHWPSKIARLMSAIVPKPHRTGDARR